MPDYIKFYQSVIVKKYSMVQLQMTLSDAEERQEAVVKTNSVPVKCSPLKIKKELALKLEIHTHLS